MRSDICADCAAKFALLQVGIAEGAVRLERSKDVFREKVKGMLETFLRELATMQEDFSRLQPTTKDGVSSTTALAFIAKWKGTVQAAHQKV
jgi:dynein heavy chain